MTQKCEVGEKPEAIGDFSRTFTIPTTDDEEELAASKKDQIVDMKPDMEPVPTTTTTTTTTQAPRTKKPEEPIPDPFEKCVLPYRTKLPFEPETELEDGIRFGNYDKTSRLEFQEPRDDGLRSDYSIDFKTSYPNGIILMKTNPDSSDFIAIYLFGGSVHYAFDSGAGIGLLNSSTLYNDGDWHTVSVERDAANGVLTVDDAVIGTGRSAGTTTSINAGTTLYVGGLSSAVLKQKFNTAKKVSGLDSPISGCLRNLLIRRQRPGEPSYRHPALEACSEPAEKGFSFYPNSGYLKLCKWDLNVRFMGSVLGSIRFYEF